MKEEQEVWKATGGIEYRSSANFGFRGIKDRTTSSGQLLDSNRLEGSIQLGKNVRADVSAGITQTINSQATVNQNGL